MTTTDTTTAALVPDAAVKAFADTPVTHAGDLARSFGEVLTEEEIRRGLAAAFAVLDQIDQPRHALRDRPDLQAVAARHAIAREAGRAADPSEGDGALTQDRWNALVRSWQDVFHLFVEVKRLSRIVDRARPAVPPVDDVLDELLAGEPLTAEQKHLTRRGIEEGFATATFSYRLGREDGIRATHAHLTGNAPK